MNFVLVYNHWRWSQWKNWLWTSWRDFWARIGKLNIVRTVRAQTAWKYQKVHSGGQSYLKWQSRICIFNFSKRFPFRIFPFFQIYFPHFKDYFKQFKLCIYVRIDKEFDDLIASLQTIIPLVFCWEWVKNTCLHYTLPPFIKITMILSIFLISFIRFRYASGFKM